MIRTCDTSDVGREILIPEPPRPLAQEKVVAREISSTTQKDQKTRAGPKRDLSDEQKIDLNWKKQKK